MLADNENMTDAVPHFKMHFKMLCDAWLDSTKIHVWNTKFVEKKTTSFQTVLIDDYLS